MMYILSRICMHARVGWLLLQRLAKQLVVDDCVPSVQNDQGVSSIEVLAGAASRHTTITI
jgi:hypothetical protein